MNILKNTCFATLLLFAIKVNAQTDKATTTKIVEEKNYAFVATTAIPLNSTDINNILMKMPGGMGTAGINLTGSVYDVVITKDSVVAYLPFYGRAYSTSMNNDENGYKFTSKDFTYESVKKKKGWSVVIKSKDVRDNVRMTLDISENGYASLSVLSNNRQSISYNGYISENKPAKEKSK